MSIGTIFSPSTAFKAAPRIPAPAPRVAAPRLHPSLKGLAGWLKRAFDVFAVLAGGALILPFLSLVALAIKLESRGPVFFKQRRVGLHGREFTLYKFRSMHPDAEARLAELQRFNEMDGPLFKMTNDPRVTAVGRFIRRTSLDELPQLLNVLWGEMSLVGPRPPLLSEVVQFEPQHLRKFHVRPGLTGLWQVSGRNNLRAFAQMIELDLRYVQQWSFGADLRILMRTVSVVLTADGAR